MRNLIGCVLLSAVLISVPTLAGENAVQTEETGQNPVMNYAGMYGAGRATILVDAKGSDEAEVSINWGASAAEHGEWEMSGPFDEENRTITYENAVKRDVVFNEDGTESSNEIVYEDGKGSFTFTEDGDLIWQDEMEHIADGTVFTFSPLMDGETDTVPESEVELNGGTVTIRLKATGDEAMDQGWENYTGDKGDATILELITQSDMEDGYAYAGSFRAMEDGEDTIYIVQTDGTVISQYMEFTFRIENGEITEQTGGGIIYPTQDSALAEVIAGEWQQTEDGSYSMQITENPEKGFDVMVYNGTGRDGNISAYRMTVRYDAMKEALVYSNGTPLELTVTDGSQEETEEDQPDGDGAGFVVIMATETGDYELELAGDAFEEILMFEKK